MLDHVEVSRILDILGNRNRRRIIELLRQKPCFVTEISDRLTLSPKAVIEHLQMMEREEILSFRLDDRRRKYYYLANDIDVMVRLLRQGHIIPVITDNTGKLKSALCHLRMLIDTREGLQESLANLEKDIDRQIRGVIEYGGEIIENDVQADLLISLAHCDLTITELTELIGISGGAVSDSLEKLKEKGIIEQEDDTYRLCGVNAQ